MMDYFALQLVVFVMVCQGLGADAYATGAASSACTSMTPGHGNEQSSSNPYTITLGSSTYTAGGSVTVTITGSDSFQGMLLQARKKGTSTIVGTFTTLASNTRTMQCTDAGNTVTHSNTKSKTNPSFTWKAPDSDMGQIEFVATVAQAKTTWWKNAKSSSISYSTGGNNAATTSTTAGTTSESSVTSSSTSSSSTSSSSRTSNTASGTAGSSTPHSTLASQATPTNNASVSSDSTASSASTQTTEQSTTTTTTKKSPPLSNNNAPKSGVTPRRSSAAMIFLSATVLMFIQRTFQ